MRASRIGTMVACLLCICAVGAMLLPALSQAATGAKIGATADKTLAQFRTQFAAGSHVLRQAKGVLVFPEVIQAGVGIGGAVW